MDTTEKTAGISDANLEAVPSTCVGIAENAIDVAPKVHFNLVQTLGMAFSVTAPPIAIGLYLNLIIGVGGSPYYVWALLVVIFFQLISCFAIAEIASAIPHSSGMSTCFGVPYATKLTLNRSRVLGTTLGA